jgi:ABC-2 type transport system ATP-binding protein
VLRVHRLLKRYGDRFALNGLSFDVQGGEVYGLLGPNGAGKTTAINIICNLLEPDEGLVEIGGVLRTDHTKTLIGVSPQENLLYRGLTCAENLHFFARLYGLKQSDRIEQVYECLETVHLLDRANDLVENLSGGMQRRLSIAVAMVHQPKLIILDEPTTGLDIEARYEIWALIRRLQSQGITILLTTHLLEEAERLCQRIGIIKAGKLLAEGTLEDLRQYVAAHTIALVSTSQEDMAIARGERLGFVHRRYGGDLAFWLPHAVELQTVLDYFQGIALHSVALQPIRLEHIYLEITHLGSSPTVTS